MGDKAKNRLRPFVHVFLLFLAATLSSACLSRPLEGKVLDATTNKPVPNAIVVGRWEKDYFHGSACVHVETATTDEQGRFRLASYWGDGPDLVYVYARNYEHIRPNGLVDYRQQLMKPFVGSNTDRLGYLTKLTRVTGCTNAGTSYKNFLPLLDALYTEARSLSRTAEDQKMVEHILYLKEGILFGDDIARKRRLERLGAQK